MNFGEKVRRLRNEKKFSRTELGALRGLALQTIRNYDVDERHPKQREVYARLADEEKDAVTKALQDACRIAKEKIIGYNN